MSDAATFARIQTLAADRGLSLRGLSLRAGLSDDFLRSWQRRLDQKGGVSSIAAANLDAIARALGVSTQQLRQHDTPVEPAPHPAPGFAEDAVEPFTMPPAPDVSGDASSLLRALFPGAANPFAYRLKTALPAFALLAGDVVAADLARLPAPGEVCLCVTVDETTASATTFLARYLPPYLLSGQFGAPEPVLRVDSPGVTVRHPVVGSLRGLPAD